MAGERFPPLIPVLIAYTAGIYLAHLDLLSKPFGWVSLFIMLVLWVVFLFLKRVRTSSWLSLGVFFFLGAVSVQAYLHTRLPSSHVSRFNGNTRLILEGTIARPPRRSPRGTQLLIDSSRALIGNRVIPTEGRVLLFLKKELNLFRLGERYRFPCKLHAPRGFHNPGGFSYERYLAFQRIHSVGFLSEERGAVKIGEGFAHPIFLRMETWRDSIRDFLEDETSPPSSGILKALVLGERGDIPDEVSEQFVTAGLPIFWRSRVTTWASWRFSPFRLFFGS